MYLFCIRYLVILFNISSLKTTYVWCTYIFINSRGLIDKVLESCLVTFQVDYIKSYQNEMGQM